MGQINWNEPECLISSYFTVKDAIFLPRWNRLANDSDALDQNAKRGLIQLFQIMDKVRELVGVPIHSHVAFRSEEYNGLVGGAKYSAHLAQTLHLFNMDYFPAAIDWSADLDGDGIDSAADCEAIRKLLLPQLEGLSLRMENNGPHGNWIHLDTKPVPPGARRFFLA